MMRLIALADSLYWIAGSLVVIGGFFVFLATVIKQLWDHSVTRKAETMRPTYNFQTNVDIYNIFFGGTAGARTAQLTEPEARTPELGTPVDLETIETLLRRLLHHEGKATISPNELSLAWGVRELATALDLCRRAMHEGVSPEMQVRCEAAATVLNEALAIQTRDV